MKLEFVTGEIKRRGYNVYSVSLADKDGIHTERLKEDSYCRNVYSVSKAYTMAAIGFLFDDGKLTPNDRIADIFGYMPDGADEKWREVTIHDVLRHKTGMTENCLDFDCDDIMSIPYSDWLDYIFNVPLEGIRGETYAYSDATYYILSRVVSKLTGEVQCDYLRKKLFVPLGFREYAWSCCPLGYSTGGSGLYVSCEDMIKLGILWLNNGVWQGKRIISEEWIRLSLENGYAFTPRDESRGWYYKTGMSGQILFFSQSDGFALAIESYMPSQDRSELIDCILPL